MYNRHDLYEMLYNQENIESIECVEWHEDFEKYNAAISSNYLNINAIKPIEIITTELEEFDKNNQSIWFLPDEYKTIDVTDYVNKLCYTEQERRRVDEELTEFSKRDMIMLLRYMIYLVDHMRENKIVWGVGRGSSVASYVLYLIGIHKINSIHYDLDWKEFLR